MDSDLDSLLSSITSGHRNKTKLLPPEEKPGQNHKELNPYWKNGGSGLPTQGDSSRKPTAMAGDGGLSWWKKALQRCRETATEERRSLEEVATERYGSLAYLHDKIKEAELCVASSGGPTASFSDNKNKRYARGRSHMKTGEADESPCERKFTDDRKNVISNKKNSNERDHHSRNDTERYARAKDAPCQNAQNYKQGTNHQPPVRTMKSTAPQKREDDSERQPAKVVGKELSIEERNKISAKLLRAEMMGDVDLAKKLKSELEGSAHSDSTGRKRNAPEKDDGEEETEILVLQNPRGSAVPYQEKDYPADPQGRRKRQKLETHKDGQRVKYFHDDDQKSLETLVREEKLNRGNADLDEIHRMAGKATRALFEDETIDDEMLRNETSNRPAKTFSKQKQLAIIEQKKMSSKIGNCSFCYANIQKHLIASTGTKAMLCLPRYKSMVPGHCLIVPLQHVVQSTVCDEDVLDEMNTYKRSLVKMFQENDEDVIFMETSKNLKSYPHLVIECVPVPREVGDMAPICFQKAIKDAGPEWSNNKKLVTIKGGVKRSIPAGFAYFHVSFGMEDGYGHVIEDEESFPWYFGREIIGGLLDLEPTLWRKPKFTSFEDQRTKVTEFVKSFNKFDLVNPKH